MVETLTQPYLRCPNCLGLDLQNDPHDPAGMHCPTCRTGYRQQDGILDLLPAESPIGAGASVDAAQAHYWEEEEDYYRPYDHTVALGFARQRADYVRQYIPLDEIASAIDVGAGNGMSTHCLENDIETIFSLDLSRRLLTQSPAQLRIRGDAYHLPFRDKCVDLIYSWELLHHVAQPRTVLTEMRRVARKYIMFFEPNRWNPAQMAFATISPPDRACLRNTRKFFDHEIARAHLEIVHHQTVGWYTPNVPPVWLYNLLKDFPFEVPWVGLSHFYLLRCPETAAPGARS